MFREIHNYKPKYFSRPIKISSSRSRYLLSTFLKIIYLTYTRKPILFSSLTPLQNFNRYFKTRRNLKFLWFTHFDGPLNASIVNILNSTQVIFVHSKFERERLLKSGVLVKIVVAVGYINTNNFLQKSKTGNKIVWIGTASKRKNSKILLSLAKEFQNLEFRILGKNWNSFNELKLLKKLKNVEFFNLTGTVNSKMLDDCSHHLILSKIEGGPISLLETIASGLIPITTRVGFAPEILEIVGYSNQIIDNPLNFDSIMDKLSLKYSKLHRNSAANEVKKFNLKRFTNILTTEIDQNLNLQR